MKDAWKEARLADNLHAETTKAMGATEQKNKELAPKLVAADRDLKSTEVGLKTAKVQAEKQRKKLHYSEIDLATTI